MEQLENPPVITDPCAVQELGRYAEKPDQRRWPEVQHRPIGKVGAAAGQLEHGLAAWKWCLTTRGIAQWGKENEGSHAFRVAKRQLNRRRRSCGDPHDDRSIGPEYIQQCR